MKTDNRIRLSFQFYDSPIKSFYFKSHPYTSRTFQFYDSPIKSNFSIERLIELSKFQFYDSPIKSRGFAKAFPLFFSFNSMIVRLKVIYPTTFFLRFFVSIL